MKSVHAAVVKVASCLTDVGLLDVKTGMYVFKKNALTLVFESFYVTYNSI